MPIGPDLVLLVLGLALAIVAATVVGGLVGRLVRERLDRRGPRVRISATPPRVPRTSSADAVAGAPSSASASAAAGGAADPTVGAQLFPAPATDPPAAVGPLAEAPPLVPGTAGPHSTYIDPEGARRLAGLPPPIATRIPTAQSPAMRDRGGVPISAGALGEPDPSRIEPPWADRPPDRRVSAAPFSLGTALPRARASVTPAPAAVPATPAAPVASAPPDGAAPAVAPHAAAVAGAPPVDRARWRGALLGTGAAALLLVAAVLASGVLTGERTGNVLQATASPEIGGVGSAVPADVGSAVIPGATLGPVMPDPSSGQGSGTGGSGTGGTGAQPGGGGGSLDGTPAPPTPRPTAGPTAAPAPTPTPDPTGPRPTPRSTTTPTDPPPTPDPTPRPTPDPTPNPTPAPTATPKPPIADFGVTVDGLTVQTHNRTRGAVSWVWTFGDGASSTARNPAHTYADAGTYTVRLVVTSLTGATDSTSKPVTVGP